MKNILVISGLFLLFLGTGCGGNSSSGPVTNPTQRTGRTVVSVEKKYVDQQPSLSADGSKMIYVSGKDDSVLRTRKTSRTTGTAFATPQLLSASTGLAEEQWATLSSDGSFVLIQGRTASGRALVLCDWAGSNCKTVTAAPWGNNQFGFSPESSGFYYLSGTANGAATLSVASVAAPTTVYQIGKADHWTHAQWIPTASGFQLAATERATAGAVNLKTFSFASLAAAGSATEVNVVSSLPAVSIFGRNLAGASGTTAATSLLISSPVKRSTSLVMPEFTNMDHNNPANPQRNIPLENQLYLYTVDGQSNTAQSITGYKTLMAFLASDGSTIFSLNRVAGRCHAEDALTFGNLLAVTATGTSSTPTWRFLKKPADLSQPPSVGTSFCDRLATEAPSSMEVGISFFTVNQAATATDHTIAWVSDMTGDPEVFAMDVAAGTPALYNVSANKKP